MGGAHNVIQKLGDNADSKQSPFTVPPAPRLPLAFLHQGMGGGGQQAAAQNGCQGRVPTVCEPLLRSNPESPDIR